MLPIHQYRSPIDQLPLGSTGKTDLLYYYFSQVYSSTEEDLRHIRRFRLSTKSSPYYYFLLLIGGGDTSWPPNVTTAPLGVTQRLLLLGGLLPEPEPPEPVTVLKLLAVSIRV